MMNGGVATMSPVQRAYKRPRARNNVESGLKAAAYLTAAQRSIGPYIKSSLSANAIESGVPEGMLARLDKQFVQVIANGTKSLGSLLFDADASYQVGESFGQYLSTAGKFGVGVGAILALQKTQDMIQGQPEYEQAVAAIGGIGDVARGISTGDPFTTLSGLHSASTAVNEFVDDNEEEDFEYDYGKIGYEVNSKGQPMSKVPIAMGGTPYSEFDVKGKHQHLGGAAIGAPAERSYGPVYMGDFYYPAKS